MSRRIYVACTDSYGVLTVEQLFTNDVDDAATYADRLGPDTIYFEVAKPANHVTFYASQDVPEGRGEPLSTWSVYREEYAPNDLDNPLDGLTVMVATVVDEATAHGLAGHLYALQAKR